MCDTIYHSDVEVPKIEEITCKLIKNALNDPDWDYALNEKLCRGDCNNCPHHIKEDEICPNCGQKANQEIRACETGKSYCSEECASKHVNENYEEDTQE